MVTADVRAAAEVKLAGFGLDPRLLLDEGELRKAGAVAVAVLDDLPDTEHGS